MSIMAAMPAFFLLVHEKLYSDGVGKKEVPDTVFTHLSRTESAFDELTKCSTMLVGSSVLGFIADPPNAKEKADQVFTEFKESYRNFFREFREFVDCLAAPRARYPVSSAANGLKSSSISLCSRNRVRTGM